MDRKVIRLLLAALAVAAVNIVFAACSRSEPVITGSDTESMAGNSSADEYTGVQNMEEDGAAADLFDAGAASFSEPGGQDAAVQVTQTIFVHVCGAVVREGVYKLQEGARVFEAVDAAGGFTQDADRDYINQAQVLCDGEQLRIPSEEETQKLSETAASADADDSAEGRAESGGRININTASAQELTALTGIGPTRAAQIIEYREAHGGFESAEDIMNVSGIGEKMYDKIKDQICTQ